MQKIVVIIKRKDLDCFTKDGIRGNARELAI